MQRERTLDADTKRLLADREGLACAVAMALDADALKDLNALAVALNHAEMDLDGVPSFELRDIPALCCFDLFDNVHTGGDPTPDRPSTPQVPVVWLSFLLGSDPFRKSDHVTEQSSGL